MAHSLRNFCRIALVIGLISLLASFAHALDVAQEQETAAANSGVAPQCKTDGVTSSAKPEESGAFLSAVREDVLSRLQKNVSSVPPEWTKDLQEDVRKYRFWSSIQPLYRNRGRLCFYNPDINEDLAKVMQSEVSVDRVLGSIKNEIYGVDKKQLGSLSDAEMAELRNLITGLQPDDQKASRKIGDSPCPALHEKLKSLRDAASINAAALASKNPLLLYLKSATPTAAEIENAKKALMADTQKGVEKIQSINVQDTKSSDTLALLMMNDSVRSVLARYPHYCGTYASLLNDLKASEKFNSMVSAGLAGAGLVTCAGAVYFSGGLLGAACFVSSASLTAGSVDKYLSTVSETGVIQAGVLGQTAKVEDLLRKQREANGLLVEAGVGALGVKTGLGSVSKVAAAEAEAASMVSRTSKLAKADEVLKAAKPVSSAGEKASTTLGRMLTQDQKDAVEAAHQVGRNPAGGPNLPGKDGKPSGIGNYTWAQLREKQKILKAKGFSDAEIRKLMEQGIVGDVRAGSAVTDLVPTGDPSYDTFRQAFSTKKFDEGSRYISYTSSESNGRRVGKIVDSRGDAILIEDEFGVRRTIQGQDLASVRVSSTAREGLDPKIQFRRSYSNGNLAESSKHDAVVISYRPDGNTQNLAVQVRKVHPNGQVEVMDSNGRSFVLSRSELESAKYSSSDTKNAFMAAAQSRFPAQAQSVAKVSSQFASQPGRTVGAAENYVSPRTVRYAGGEARFEVRSTPEFRDLAERQGLLKEFSSASDAKNLAPGNYSYLITRDGKLVVGKVEDSFELGVKHQNLANGREVVSAGELSVTQSGAEFNLLSGTYTRHMTESGQVSEALLRGRTQNALQEFFGSSVKSTERSILPNSSPSLDTIRKACGQKSFLSFNMMACCQTVRIGCN